MLNTGDKIFLLNIQRRDFLWTVEYIIEDIPSEYSEERFPLDC